MFTLPAPVNERNGTERKRNGTKRMGIKKYEITSIAQLIRQTEMILYVVHTCQANQRQHMLISNQVIIFRATL